LTSSFALGKQSSHRSFLDGDPDAPPKERPEHWIMYFGGALNLEGAGAGVLLISPQGEQLKYVLQIHYKVSNNGAEYEALIHGPRIVVSLGIKRLLAFGDSKAVIEQVNREWDCVKYTMDAYFAEIRKLEGYFEGINFQHIPRNNNVAADVIFKLGSRRALVQQACSSKTYTSLQSSSWILIIQSHLQTTKTQHLPATCSCLKKGMIGASRS
jgi:ribonuclease HI